MTSSPIRDTGPGRTISPRRHAGHGPTGPRAAPLPLSAGHSTSRAQVRKFWKTAQPCRWMRDAGPGSGTLRHAWAQSTGHPSKLDGQPWLLTVVTRQSSSHMFSQMVDGSQPQVSISKSKQSPPTAPVAPQLMRVIVSDEESRRAVLHGCQGFAACPRAAAA